MFGMPVYRYHTATVYTTNFHTYGLERGVALRRLLASEHPVRSIVHTCSRSVTISIEIFLLKNIHHLLKSLTRLP